MLGERDGAARALRGAEEQLARTREDVVEVRRLLVASEDRERESSWEWERETERRDLLVEQLLREKEEALTRASRAEEFAALVKMSDDDWETDADFVNDLQASRVSNRSPCHRKNRDDAP